MGRISQRQKDKRGTGRPLVNRTRLERGESVRCNKPAEGPIVIRGCNQEAHGSNAVAAPPLVDNDVLLGKEAAQVLSEDDFLQPVAIFWWYSVPHETWRFVVATKLYDNFGAQTAYLRIRKTLAKADLLDRLPLHKVWAAETTEPIVEAVRSLARTGAHKVTVTHVTTSTIHDVRVDDAVIYYVSSS